MVELSIVLTLVFLPLIYGLITFGYAFSIRENMTHAAQEALRQAIINAQSSSISSAGVACNAVTDARNRMAGTIGTTHDQATVTDMCSTANPNGGLDITTSYNSATTGFPACPTGLTPPGTCMTITMIYQYHKFPIIAPLPGIFELLPQTLKVTATERIG
ncbi:MAG: hypothetical protein NVS3B21_01040 [Acidimicrobiales bacterium]